MRDLLLLLFDIVSERLIPVKPRAAFGVLASSDPARGDLFPGSPAFSRDSPFKARHLALARGVIIKLRRVA
jgi:hypothetical protein